MDGGAHPDKDIPTVYYKDKYDAAGWQDEEDQEAGLVDISHEGGERHDRARATFEYIVLPR